MRWGSPLLPPPRCPEPRHKPPRPPFGIGLSEFHSGLLGLSTCGVAFMLQDNNPSVQRVGMNLGLIGADSEPVGRSLPVAFGLENTNLAGTGRVEAVDHRLRPGGTPGGVHPLLAGGGKWQVASARFAPLAQRAARRPPRPASQPS
jgi:hypothetical protein